MNLSNQLEPPPKDFESKKYQSALATYLDGVAYDGSRRNLQPNAISWGQEMFAAGILLGKLGQETSVTDLISLLRSMSLPPDNKEFQLRVLYLYDA